jgi:formylglycine-generating enzyme required for sulfatase activity
MTGYSGRQKLGIEADQLLVAHGGAGFGVLRTAPGGSLLGGRRADRGARMRGLFVAARAVAACAVAAHAVAGYAVAGCAVAGCAVASGAVAGCAEAAPARGDPAPSAPASEATTVAVASPSASAATSRAPGACGGRAIGAHACDGAALVRCGESAAEAVRQCLDIERCDAEKAACVPGCPKGMVYVPATGPEGFMMGKNLMEGSEGKNLGKGHIANTDIPHRVVLTKPFCLDQSEVTVRDYKVCMKDQGCRKPDLEHRFVMWPDHDDYPVNCVSWHDAVHYCGTVGKTLPTEAQWEWAATGGDGRAYPWGNEKPSCEHADYVPGVLGHPAGDAGCGMGGPSPVGSHPKGDKLWPDGPIHDLAGNVWEWCLDNYRPYKREPQTDPLVWLSKDLPHSLRGGGWNRSHQGIKAAFRGAGTADYRVPGLGFRCALNPGGGPKLP